MRLVTIAELTKNKGIRYAIDAVAELAHREIDVVYVVAGEGEERRDLERYVSTRGVADRVFFPGFIEGARQYLAGFDVFVLPSLKEGMPYVLLEAVAAGIPILATTAVDEEFLARIPNARRVERGDALALADAILELSHLPRLPERNAGPSLESMLRQTIEIYRA